jgi:radical SAM protein with 4Fe4S-binding SPASM domain
MERDHPELCQWGDMDTDILFRIALQTPKGTVVQLHNNGEPLLYPYLSYALYVFGNMGCIRCFNTNGKLLVEKANEIIGNMEVLTISVIENDPEGDEQYELVKQFLSVKGDRAPRLVYRLLGRVDKPERWEALPGVICARVLHAPWGSYDYQRQVTVPEIGICLDLLTHLAVDRYGNISLCVRFDRDGCLRLGNIKSMSLEEAWFSEKRKAYLREHIAGNRISLPGCGSCEFYGVPTS